VDLLAPGALAFQGDFDLILCDAPCSGSGTWAHNPENIQSFKEADLEEYYQKQTGIARKAWSRLRPGGYFLYMTCSVFERENEQVSQFIADNSGMELVMQKVVTGAAKNQVSMFAALYTRKK
jgi:16S rRNA (cytosine967-C5)-methyltransferase